MTEYREYINRLQKRLSQAEQRAATASQKVQNYNSSLTTKISLNIAKILTSCYCQGRGGLRYSVLLM